MNRTNSADASNFRSWRTLAWPAIAVTWILASTSRSAALVHESSSLANAGLVGAAHAREVSGQDEGSRVDARRADVPRAEAPRAEAPRADAAPRADVSRTDVPRAVPVSGLVLDVSGRRPLADYQLELRGGDRVERVVTGADGRFGGAVAFATGTTIVVTPIDAEGVDPIPMQGGLPLLSVANPAQSREWKGEPLELEVAVGPEFDLELVPSKVEGAPLELASAPVRLFATSPGAVDEGVRLRASVRSDGANRRWVRFAPLPRATFLPPFGAKIVVEHGDAVWRAEADVSPLVRSRGGKVALSWTPCARWTGMLRDGTGAPVAGTWLTLSRTDDNGVLLERRRARTDLRGRYEFAALEPGRWQLRGSPLRHNEFESVLRTLAAKDDSVLNLSLDPVRERLPLMGKVTGAAVTEGAAPPAAVEVVLRRSGEILPQDSVRPDWVAEDGRWTASFAFATVPAGEYQLQLLPPNGDEDHWPTRTATTKSGAAPVSFVRN